MTMNVSELNYSNTEGKRFYLRENGRIIYKYDSFSDQLYSITQDQDVIIEDKSNPYALPEPWYYSINCPDYIIVTDVNSYNTIDKSIGKRLSASAYSQTSGNQIVITIEIRHNQYKHIRPAGGLNSEAELSNVTDNIEEGVEESLNMDNAQIMLNGFDPLTANIVNGRCSVTLNGSTVTSKELSGHIIIDNHQPFYFYISNIQLIESVENANKIDDIRQERDARLQACDWLVIRHITQHVVESVTPTLSESAYDDLCIYMQELRDLPENIQDFDDIEWPEIPQSLRDIL